MFGIGLIAAGTLMHLFVFLRAASVPLVRRHVPRKILIGVALFLWALFAIGLLAGHGGTGAAAAALEFFGMTWMAALFLAFAALLAVDLLTGFGLLFQKRVPVLRGLALAAAAALSAIALVQGMRPPIVKSYEVELGGLPRNLDGTVLVGMSDLHAGSLLGGRWLEGRVEQVQALHPDIVVLLGDLFEGHGRTAAALAPILSRLSAPQGVFAVTGNHEHYSGDEGGVLLSAGGRIQVLHNRWAQVRPGLVLAGVDDLTENRRSSRNDDLIARALAGRPPGATILLSHTPWGYEEAAEKGVGLMLSGHTHGGQIWPFGYLSRIFYPLQAGRYQMGDMAVIVCRGTGTWGPRMRLWHPGEIIRVTIRARRG